MNNSRDLVLTIPTYRPDDISKTVEVYANNFKKYNHNVPIMVFDDSNYVNSVRSKENLEVVTQNIDGDQKILYIGPKEKSEFIYTLKTRFDSKHEATIERIFRPSYGGNRNCILAYTLGRDFISVDDDMLPQGQFILSGQLKNGRTISNGNFIYQESMNQMLTINQDQDIVTGYKKFIGTYVRDHLGKVITGSKIIDPNVDHLGFTIGNLDQSELQIEEGYIPQNAKIKIVQTHLTGDADIDSVDLVNLFMKTGLADILEGYLPKKHVLISCREAVTANNNRLTGAILGYDNSEGGIYFLPTTFRCEDFIWRMYLERMPGIASAYTEHTQTHARSVSVRNSIAKDWLNEMVAQIVKEKMVESVNNVGKHYMTFHKPTPVKLKKATEIEECLRERKNYALSRIPNSKRLGKNYARFAEELDNLLRNEVKSSREFAKNLTNVINEEFNWFNKTATLWPQILDYLYDGQTQLPVRELSLQSAEV